MVAYPDHLSLCLLKRSTTSISFIIPQPPLTETLFEIFNLALWKWKSDEHPALLGNDVDEQNIAMALTTRSIELSHRDQSESSLLYAVIDRNNPRLRAGLVDQVGQLNSHLLTSGHANIDFGSFVGVRRCT